MPSTLKNAVIPASEVVTAPRGRKKELDNELLSDLRQVDAQNGIQLGGTFGSVKGKDGTLDTKKKQNVSATIRKHWEEIYGDGDDAPKPKIDFHPETGIPQVRMKSRG